MSNQAPRTFRSRRPLKVILIVLLCLVLAAAILFISLFFGLQEHIAYTDEGELYLDLPWLDEYMHPDNVDDQIAEQIQ